MVRECLFVMGARKAWMDECRDKAAMPIRKRGNVSMDEWMLSFPLRLYFEASNNL
jgi:hypothetical protein